MIYTIEASEKARKLLSGETVVFRSLLEARWSLVFDRLHLKWKYEPKMFRLPTGYYTPDFRVGDMWLEIKPTSEHLKAVEPKLHAFVKYALPRDHRFFSLTAIAPEFASTGFGRLAVIEWTDKGVRYVRKHEALDLFCAEKSFRDRHPLLYERYVDKTLQVSGVANFQKPILVMSEAVQD